MLGIEGYQTGWGPNAFVQNNFEWRDVASFTRGSHNLKVGGNVTRGRADHESSRVYNRPQFVSSTVFLTSPPTLAIRISSLVLIPPRARASTNSIAWFATDHSPHSYKTTGSSRPNLTVNLGFRYEDFFNPSDGLGDEGVCNMAFPSSGGA